MPSIAALGSIFFLLLAVGLPNTAWATAETTLHRCQAQVGIHGANFIKNRARATSNCLKRISIELIKKNAADVSKAANVLADLAQLAVEGVDGPGAVDRQEPLRALIDGPLHRLEALVVRWHLDGRAGQACASRHRYGDR